MRNIEMSLSIEDFDRTRILGTNRATVAMGADLQEMFQKLLEMRHLTQMAVVWESSHNTQMWKTFSVTLKTVFEKVLERREGAASAVVMVRLRDVE